MIREVLIGALAAAAAGLLPSPAHAAALDGAAMGWPWTLPFFGTLSSIALGPVLFPKIWHRHHGKISAGWAALTVGSIAFVFGAPAALAAFVHAMLGDYLSFIVLLFALYTTAGGILVTGAVRGAPLTNTAVLAGGTFLASIVGTTGAAMILIRPLLRANAQRSHNAHLVVFFIILVCNVGGALSRSAIRRCLPVFCVASISSGRCRICGGSRRWWRRCCWPLSLRLIVGATAGKRSGRRLRRRNRSACAAR